MERQATIDMLVGTAATHRRVGNADVAEKFEAKAARYAAMSDDEFAAEKARNHNPARDQMAHELAQDLFKKMGK